MWCLSMEADRLQFCRYCQIEGLSWPMALVGNARDGIEYSRFDRLR